MQVPHNAHVLVADGRKMLFFKNEGDGDYPNLQVVHAEEQDNPKDSDQKTDLAGGASSTNAGGMGGGAGSSMGETDFHQQEEDRFAAQAAELLKKKVLSHQVEKLVIVAPPKTLGELRKHFHKEVESRIVGELDKDLTGHPVDQIEKALQNA